MDSGRCTQVVIIEIFAVAEGEKEHMRVRTHTWRATCRTRETVKYGGSPEARVNLWSSNKFARRSSHTRMRCSCTTWIMIGQRQGNQAPATGAATHYLLNFLLSLEHDNKHQLGCGCVPRTGRQTS